MTMDCIFCKIVDRQAPATIVSEDTHWMAFENIHPQAPVHILVIPKEHVESIAHLSDGHSEMISGLIFAAKRIAASKGLKGYKIGFNVGREAGQSVDHLHLHLLGGWTRPEDAKREFGT